jgi:hypothetical protein
VNAGHLLIAYHGCDVTTRDDLVSGRLRHLSHSNNRYDWLGPGAYFFEGDLERALMFSQASHDNPSKMYTVRPIGTPAAVGVALRVQSWLDMTTQAGIQEFTMAYQSMVEGLHDVGDPVPVNSAASDDDPDILLRALDNAVFTFLHDVRANSKPPLSPFQAVRGAFHQGPEIAHLSGFHKSTHVQIALRDDHCVEGWFLPRGAQLLTEQQYKDAQTRLDAMKVDRKPRKRASK